MMKISVPVELTADQVQRLINVAYASGWSQDHPRMGLTSLERRAAVRRAVNYLVSGATIMKREET